jgi:hypothetical protein
MELDTRNSAATKLQGAVLDLASYTLKQLRRDGEFILYRGHPAPQPLSAIVMKLLAKTPEERYQTAGGVEHDLRRCLAAWEAQHRIDPFALGEHDTPSRLVIPERLYGRSQDIATLLEAFERMVSSGKPQLVLISGYSGIGKSSVINELHRALVPSRGRSRRSACSRRSARGGPMRS